MEASGKPRVKVCCINSIDEAKAAVRCGASAIGLVSSMPSGPGVISDETILEIAQTVPPPIGTFLLTSKTESRAIIEHHKRVRTNTIQIVDKLTNGTYGEIKRELQGIKLVQVIHVRDETAIHEAEAISEHVDALLLDSGNPNLSVKELGGTGRTHNWEISARIRKLITIPIFLAGGLTPSNVRQAIDIVGPFGVDVCSGVRTNRKLDLIKLERFFEAITR
jgi:phosphoribosylanthranilate isomerase